ncbi:MAG TPA: cell wall-binding repeat-containing protein, partial [Acidimicrobiia bacterium]|nr:cell wall-binding repeat-containing protein [Acidimicrobiia bacterium]
MIRNIPHRIAPVIVAALFVALVVPVARAADPSTPVTIDGGGWGHGIGMPQYGMRGQAEEGWTYDQILAYWYDGTGLRQASEVVPAVPTTVRVGINYVDLGSYVEYRPFRWQDFHVEQDQGSTGVVTACLPGEAEGECSVTVDAGVTWRYQWSDAYFDGAGGCQFKRAGVIQYSHQTACDIRLYWTDQPSTRIAFPDVDIGRTFARGHIAFLGPVTVNNVRGFHFNVVLDLDEYVLGLAEIPPSWHMEALKAQIVAARTYGAEKAKNGIRGDCSCHLVWSTFDQAYRGWHPLNEGNGEYGQRWYDAVMATAGEVVVYPAGGTGIAETYYASSTGGATEFVSDMWGSNQASYPYLASKPDPWSEIYASTPTESTTIRWRHTRTAGEIVTALTTECQPDRVPFPGLTELTDIEIVETHASGSPRAVKVTGVADGQVTSKTFYHRADDCDDRWSVIRSRLGIRGHFIYSFTGLTQPERLAGADRYETAVAVSQSTHPEGADVVYLAVGMNYPDALAGGPAAAAESAPILLVTETALPASTRTELQRLAPSTVVVLGGPAAIADSVLSAAQSVLPGATIGRRQGATRYETAVAVSSAVFSPGVGTVYVASGEYYADALIAAPAAAVGGSPLLLVRSDAVPAAVATELTRLAPGRIVVVGGPTAVSDAVVSQLGSFAGTVDRISGNDRYAVAAAISADAFPGGADTAYISIGTDFPDALAGGPAAASDPGPLLLVTTNSIP